MLRGKLIPGAMARAKHDKEVIGEAEVESVQKERIDAKELIEKEVGGLMMKTTKKINLQVGDRLEFFSRETRKRKLD